MPNITNVNWTVYILKCKYNTLYTGITNNLKRRISQHQSAKGAKYTKGRAPLQLVYQEISKDKSTALKREIQIKKLTRKQKLDLFI
jgi:putative endonuclease